MSALAFWKAVVSDRSNFLERAIGLLEDGAVRYCVIGGVGVNAYAEPVVTQDLDVVVAAEDLARARRLFEAEFEVEEFEHRLNVRDSGSRLQVQLQLDPAMEPFVERAERREVMDLVLPVASALDLLHAKVVAAGDPARRASKRQKDLADIARLVEVFPALMVEVPAEIRARLVD